MALKNAAMLHAATCARRRRRSSRRISIVNQYSAGAMNGTPKYAMRDHPSATFASTAEYIPANVAIQIATTTVIVKNAELTLVTRRASTRAPKARMSTAVNATGTDDGEKAYPPDMSFLCCGERGLSVNDEVLLRQR